MTESLVDSLNDKNIDSGSLVHAMRYYVAAEADYRTPDEMYDELAAAIGDTKELELMLEHLKADPDLLEETSLAVLQLAWQQADSRHAIQDYLDTARHKLPVIEVGVIAIAAMYGMFLLATKGVKEQHEEYERDADGRYRLVRTVKHFDATGPLSAVTRLFRQGPDQPA